MTKARNIAELANDISVDNNRDVTLSNLRSDQPMMFRNKIINGDMRIDQRNGGSSVTPTNSSPTDYTLDRWKFSVLQPSKLTCQQVSDAPAGFNKSIKVTSSSSYNPSSNDYFLVQQRIEGYNTSDLNWGTLNAKSITVSFWVKSSLTGTFSGAVRNSDGFGRGYVFEYTVGVADTWEYKSLSLVGDTEGTWATDNNKSIELGFSLGAGSDFYASAGAWNPTNDFATSGSNNLVQTSGATFYITGVQLEEGTVATPFEHRPYGTELALCQRYYYLIGRKQYARYAIGYAASAAIIRWLIFFKTTMRTVPDLEQSGNFGIQPGTLGAFDIESDTTDGTGNQCLIRSTNSSGLSAGNAVSLHSNNDINAYLAFYAEL